MYQNRTFFKQLLQVQHQGKMEYTPKGLKRSVLCGIFSHHFEAHPVSPYQSAHKCLNNLHSCVPCRGIKIAHKSFFLKLSVIQRKSFCFPSSELWRRFERNLWYCRCLMRTKKKKKKSIKDSAN